MHAEQRMEGLRRAPVRIQWDPERDIHLPAATEFRAIQMGLSGEAVDRYLDNWIVGITNVTALSREIPCLNGSRPDPTSSRV